MKYYYYFLIMCTNHPQNNDDSYTQKCVIDIVWLTIKNIYIY